MAGSYNHCVNDDGTLAGPSTIAGMLENGGDIYEAVEQMYGMIWLLADGNAQSVEDARQRYREGLEVSPGVTYRWH